MKLKKAINLRGILKTSNSTKLLVGIALGLIVLGLWGRFVPHPPNFAPIAAIALFSGAYLPKNWAVVVPMLALIVSDLFIGLHNTLFWTWGSFALIALFSSTWLRGRVSFLTTTGSALTASVFFYLVTNFGVWLQSGMYPLTTSGLATSYINGLPFFRNTILGDLFYCGLLFGAYAFAVSLAKNKLATTKY